MSSQPGYAEGKVKKLAGKGDAAKWGPSMWGVCKNGRIVFYDKGDKKKGPIGKPLFQLAVSKSTKIIPYTENKQEKHCFKIEIGSKSAIFAASDSSAQKQWIAALRYTGENTVKAEEKPVKKAAEEAEQCKDLKKSTEDKPKKNVKPTTKASTLPAKGSPAVSKPAAPKAAPKASPKPKTSLAAAQGNEGEQACQSCQKRKVVLVGECCVHCWRQVKARVTLEGRLWLLCKACTLERTAQARQESAATETEKESKASSRRHHHHHHHHHHHKAHGKDKDSASNSHEDEEAAEEDDEKERANARKGVSVSNAADDYSWSDEDGDKNPTSPRLQVKINAAKKSKAKKEKAKKSDSDDSDDDHILQHTSKILRTNSTPVGSPGTAGSVSRRRSRQNRTGNVGSPKIQAGDLEYLEAVSSPAKSGSGKPSRQSSTQGGGLLDLFDLDDVAENDFDLAALGDELLVPEPVMSFTTTASPARSRANTPVTSPGVFHSLSAEPLQPMLPTTDAAPLQPTAATSATTSTTTATTTTTDAPAALDTTALAEQAEQQGDAAQLMTLAKRALDERQAAVALSCAEKCVRLLQRQGGQNANQLAYAAKYVCLLRLTNAALSNSNAGKAALLSYLSASVRVSAQHRAAALRASIVRCGRAKEWALAASLLRLILTTNPSDKDVLESQLAKCVEEGEKNDSIEVSPIDIYCAASLSPLSAGPAIRCSMCELHYSMEEKLATDVCDYCHLQFLQSVQLDKKE